MYAAKKFAVAGATGRLGRHIVDRLERDGHDVVAMSRSQGVDLVTGEGLDAALDGVDVVIDAATGSSPDEQAATSYFTAATRNLQQASDRAGVERIVVISIVGSDRFSGGGPYGGYYVAKVAQERAMLAGPVPVQIVRATQFHEFVGQLVDWGRQGDVSYVPRIRTQLIAASALAEVVVDIATGRRAADPMVEVAGTRVERLDEVARLLAARRGEPQRIEVVSDPTDPDRELFENDGLLPGPDAIITGPTFEQWLKTDVPSTTAA